jgi:hypothetical protein
LKLDILNDKTMLAVANSLSFSENKINNVKGNETMEIENLKKANETLNELKDSDVRIMCANEQYLDLDEEKAEYNTWPKDTKNIKKDRKIKL